MFPKLWLNHKLNTDSEEQFESQKMLKLMQSHV